MSGSPADAGDAALKNKTDLSHTNSIWKECPVQSELRRWGGIQIASAPDCHETPSALQA